MKYVLLVLTLIALAAGPAIASVPDDLQSVSVTIKAGNAQAGGLTTMFDGSRPATLPNPMRKQGAIALNIFGQVGNAGQGNFFEGVMTAGYSSDAADDAVQANVVAVYSQ